MLGRRCALYPIRIGLMFVAATAVSDSQIAVTPKFEVASIRVCKDGESAPAGRKRRPFPAVLDHRQEVCTLFAKRWRVLSGLLILSTRAAHPGQLAS